MIDVLINAQKNRQPVIDRKGQAFKSNWTGSSITANLVANQLKNRFGEEAVKEYDPTSNCLTCKDWNRLGYKVKRGTKSIRSFKMEEVTNDKGEIIGKTYKPVFLFFKSQVQKMRS